VGGFEYGHPLPICGWDRRWREHERPCHAAPSGRRPRSETPEPATPEEIRSQLEILSDGIRALQSLDDLGSPEANQRAWDQMVALQAKHARLEEKVRNV